MTKNEVSDDTVFWGQLLEKSRRDFFCGAVFLE
jgi:hypothetical protein